MGLNERFPAYGGRGPGDLRLGIALGLVATVLMILRVYVRLRINKFGTRALIWAFVAWTFTAITQIFGVLSVLHGLGNHITVLEKSGELNNFFLLTWITVFFFNLAIPTGKVAVAEFLIEMNAQSNPKIRRSLYAVAILNIFLNIPQVVLIWVQCSPSSALWDHLHQGQCDHRKSVNFTYFVGAIAAISDFYLAIIPISMLTPLRIDRKLKWGLSFLMGCGVFAGVAAIVRTWAARYILSEDPSYGVGMLFRWGEVEEWVVLISMSIPPIWPLIRPFTQSFFNSNLPRSQPGCCKQQQYGSTAAGDQVSPSFPPLLVTTTMSISSTKGVIAKATPLGALSQTTSRISNHDDNQYELSCFDPELAFESKSKQEGWVGLPGLKDIHR